jgi:hypothetical protein
MLTKDRERLDFLKELAELYNVPVKRVFELAGFIASNDDFTKLIEQVKQESNNVLY